MLYLGVGRVLLTAVLSAVCTARVISYSAPDVFNNAIVTRQDSDTSSECEPTCGLTSCGGNVCTVSKKRSLDGYPGFLEDGPSYNDSYPSSDGLHYLNKRNLQTPQTAGAIAQLLSEQGQTAGINLICPTGAQQGYTYCLQQEFSTAPPNANGQWTAGTANTELTGCTVLTIVSARAVYMCHFWEDLNYRQSSPRYIGFQPVLDLIQSGTQAASTAGVALDTTLFTAAGDNTVAFISTPRAFSTNDDDSTQRWPAQYTQLANLIQQLIPGVIIGKYNYALPSIYDAATATWSYPNEYQGVALFIYDSNANGRGTPNWQLWYENNKESGYNVGQIVA